MEKEAKNIQELTFEITKDNLLHCLMHTATRENIAELRAENKADVLRLNDKLDTKASKADVDKLNDKIERIADKMDGKFSALSDKLDKKLNKHFMWLTGLMLGGFSTIAIMMINFMKMKF